MNDKTEKHIKCVNFDLSTEELLKHFPNGTAKPYELLKQFFLNNDFEHNQYSGYISKKPLTIYEASLIIKKLGTRFIWIKDCMQKFDISNAPKERDMRDLIIESAEEKIQELTQQLQKELKYYTKHENSLYDYAKKQSEDRIFKLYTELNTNANIQLDEKIVKMIETIIKERANNKNL